VSSRWWFPFDGMEELAFKRVQSGWVFGAPNPWLFGSRRYYLLNDGQKSEVAACARRMWRLLFVTMLASIAAGIPIAMPVIYSHPLAVLAAAALAGLAVGIAANTYLYRATRPIVAGLEPKAERITQGEAFRTQIAVYSRGHIIFFGLLSLVLFALCASPPLLTSAGWDTLSVCGVLMFGGSTIYWLVLYLAKHRPSTA
jgi:hypothetical protein